MKLAHWLKQQKIKRIHFAAQIGISPAHVTGLCSGDKWPGRRICKQIVLATQGAVGPQDFLDGPESNHDTAA